MDEEEAQTTAHRRPSCRAHAHGVSWAHAHGGPVGTVQARAHGVLQRQLPGQPVGPGVRGGPDVRAVEAGCPGW